MVQIGLVGGVRKAFLLMGLGVGNQSIPLWIFLSLLSILRWEMELGCYFARTSDVGINQSKINYQTFLEWHLQVRPLCKRFCLGIGMCTSGISLLLEAQMIGKRKSFSICYLYLQN